MFGSRRFDFGKTSDSDIRLLYIFRTVVEAGGFSAAEIELDIAQSTVSRSMSELESQLGFRLCERGRGGFSLTDKGVIAYEECLKLFAALDGYQVSMTELRGDLSGKLRMGVIDNSALDPSYRLPDLILQFIERCPDVHLTIDVVSPNEIERSIIDGKFQVGIGVFHQHHPSIQYESYFSETLKLYCGRGNPLFEMSPNEVKVEDLRLTKFASSPYFSSQNINARSLGCTTSATAYHQEGLAFLIMSGKFVGFLPERYANIWVNQDVMHPILIEHHSHEVEFEIITQKRSRVSPIVKVILDLLLNQK